MALAGYALVVPLTAASDRGGRGIRRAGYGRSSSSRTAPAGPATDIRSEPGGTPPVDHHAVIISPVPPVSGVAYNLAASWGVSGAFPRGIASSAAMYAWPRRGRSLRNQVRAKASRAMGAPIRKTAWSESLNAST
jgi:hypothetical protein